MWMIDATQPELSAEIDNRNLRETTLGLIEEYGILRRRAWDCSFGRKCIVLPARLDTHHLVEAIDGLGLNLTVLFKELFNAIEPYVAERLDLLDVINWGEEAPDEQARAGEDVRESAHNHCDSYWSLRTASLDAGESNTLDTATRLIIDELDFMDDGRYECLWSNVDVCAAVERLASDNAEIHSKLVQLAAYPALHTRIGDYVQRQCSVEQALKALGQRLRYLMAQHADALRAQRLIGAVRQSANCNHLVLTLDVYEMFCRRAKTCTRSSVEETRETFESAPTVDWIRGHAESFETCYLLDSTSLPPGLRHIGERFCLAVRLPEKWHHHVESLSNGNGLMVVDSYQKETGEFRRNLTPSKAFWAPFNEFLPVLGSFRSSLPVVYIFEQSVVVVRHRFNVVADVPRITNMHRRDVVCVTIERDEWTYAAAHYVTNDLDGRQLKPTILQHVQYLDKFSSASRTLAS
ncbi:hypothetical protein [Paraburkholderia caledonica]|uniref:hypothetical protein n=1 Tax=Paraburkholderia caledonica TaxID=134536 RepID=UPI0011778157|nr:hypothetical protein [Paraburkholderia caledonica]